MGTSSSYGGNSGGNPLLPPWAQDPAEASPSIHPDGEDSPDGNDTSNGNAPEQQEEKSTPIGPIIGNPRGPKTQLGRFFSTGEKKYLKRAAKNYVKQHNGSKSISSSALGGKKGAVSFGNFLSSIGANGTSTTLNSFGLSSFQGKAADEALAEFGNLIAPVGNTNEESAARHALLETLSDLYEEYDLGEKGLTHLDTISPDDLQNIFQSYVVNYIFNRWMQEYGKYVEDKTISAAEMEMKEEHIRSYIETQVVLDFDDSFFKIDLDTQHGRLLVDKIFEDAYSLI